MIDIKILLPELRKLVHELSEDLLTRVSNDSALNAGLQEAYKQIEKGGRASDPYEVWLEDYLDQVAVAWILSCVFVRFMEDNDLIGECWLAGRGERRQKAGDSHELYFRTNPLHSDREFFEHVFMEVGKIPACRDLFAEGKTPLWAVGPSGDAAMKLLSYWREMDSESGQLKRTFDVEDGETRFLGDLYQDLSEKARKKYALLQTPVFVEEFILDHTLDPAIAVFGLKELRMIDPTCGSGHFLLGGFSRLFRLWSKPENTTGNVEKDAQMALSGVWGCDINPFAIAIARFRLIVAALRACDLKRLNAAPGWNINLATGDSLLFGKRWDTTGNVKSEQQFFDTEDEGSWAPEIYACEDKEAISQVLGQQYHAVVGNPPYITVKDKSLNQAYRNRYSACHRSYSLSVPFMQRFFDLCITQKDRSGFTGMITANSFMKREFGKKLIEEFLSTVDVTHVIDTSGAYIPGHGTPTVILFGRNRPATSGLIRAVLGIAGEPSTPAEPSLGHVWSGLANHLDEPGYQDAFITVVDSPRIVFQAHPWSIGGGGATELKQQIDESSIRSLGELADIGFTAVTREDEVFLVAEHVATRFRIPQKYIRPLVSGDEIRDWRIPSPKHAIFPYAPETLVPEKCNEVVQFLWPWKRQLSSRVAYGLTQLERGLPWFAYSMLFTERLKASVMIVFPSVATHNHFVVERAGKVFKDTAPMIRLLDEQEPDFVYHIIGLLNSSTVCFWMKQIAHNKGDSTDQHGARTTGDPAFNTFAFNTTLVGRIPIVQSGPVNLARELDSLGEKLNRVCSSASEALHKQSDLRTHEQEFVDIRRRMIALQEELDWECYKHYSLCDEDHRYSGDDLPTIEVGERAFEFVLAKQILAGEVESNWFKRHGVHPKTDIPPHWPEGYRNLVAHRIKLIENNQEIGLIEKPEFKRRWNSESWHDQQQRSLRNSLLHCLESDHYWPDPKEYEPRLQSVAKLADKASSDQNFMRIAVLFRGKEDFELVALIAELVESESVPLLPITRYKAAGLRKREVWEKTWELQRKEDTEGGVSDIKVPPKYASTDFLKTDYWRLRGKLDVPKERWISFPNCETDSDPTLIVGWAGWTHLQQGTAIVAYYDARKNEGWPTERLTPLLAALDQLLPWIHQWHPEIDPEYNESAGISFQTLLDSEALELGLTIEDIRNWTPPAKKVEAKKSTPKQPRQSRKKKAEVEAEE